MVYIWCIYIYIWYIYIWYIYMVYIYILYIWCIYIYGVYIYGIYILYIYLHWNNTWELLLWKLIYIYIICIYIYNQILDILKFNYYTTNTSGGDHLPTVGCTDYVFSLSLLGGSSQLVSERRRKPGSDLVLILISFRDGFRGSFARTVLAFAATCIS